MQSLRGDLPRGAALRICSVQIFEPGESPSDRWWRILTNREDMMRPYPGKNLLKVVSAPVVLFGDASQAGHVVYERSCAGTQNGDIGKSSWASSSACCRSTV